MSGPGTRPSIVNTCPLTETGGAGGRTVSVRWPRFPSLAASIVTAPDDRPVTSPAGVTVATMTLSDAHVTARPVSLTARASYVVAVACTLSPTANASLGAVT